MAYVRAQFRDAAAILPPYQMQIMWNEEEGLDLRRNYERTTVTSGVGFVRQQGEDSPSLLRFRGTILHSTQMFWMTAYYQASRDRTIFFRDFGGSEYEVLFTAFNPQRVRTLHNPRDSTIPLHYWTYDMELEVVG
jgi:hypothetical protein